MFLKLFFIVNPAAKNGYSLRIWKKIEKRIINEAIEYEVYFTKHAGDGSRQVRNILQNTKEKVLIIAVGGDGTIHEIINGVYPNKNAIISYIPAGSGNDFARGYRIPRNPKQALEHNLRLLAKNKTITEFYKVDCGLFQVEDSTQGCFINNLGVGFDAAVAKVVNESKVKRLFNKFGLGKLIYILILIKELFNYQTSRIKLHIDGEEKIFENVWLVTISNQPYFGGGLKITPDAVVNDGRLDVIIVNNISRWKILFLFITVLWGGHKKIKGVNFAKGRKINIESEKQIPIHADGEYKGVDKVSVHVAEKAIAILNDLKTYE